MPIIAGEPAILVQVELRHLETRLAGHAQHLSGLRIHHKDRAAERACLRDLRLQFALDQPLDVAIDREADIATGLRLLPDALAAELNPVSDTVALEVDGAGCPTQFAIEVTLDASEPDMVAPDEPEQRRREVTLRIRALGRADDTKARCIRGGGIVGRGAGAGALLKSVVTSAAESAVL